MEKYKILIIEDSEDTVEILRKRFRADGYITSEAYDGKEGLKKVSEFGPDIIILDIMIPLINGFEVCKRLKSDENTRYIPIIMLTAKIDTASKVTGLDVGGDDYLAKPFDYNELAARVRSLLGRKAASEELIEHEKSEALEKMTTQMEHEIRNPLAIIGGLARRVHESLRDNDPGKKHLEVIMQNIKKLEHTTDRLLDLEISVITCREQVNINEIIMGVLEKNWSLFEENQTEIVTDLTNPLPQILADRNQIRVVLVNIIDNAIEALQESSTRILKIKTRLRDDCIIIDISDTGSGISEENIKDIKNPFFTSKTYGGLGLAVANKIVQAHGGKMDINSELHKGTKVTINLPRKTPSKKMKHTIQ
jgi:two-component system sensor histidine kinase/response regulator